MKNKINILFVVLFCAFAAVLYIVIFSSDWTAVSQDHAAQGIRQSQPAQAPDFTLLNLDGKKVRLSDYRGKVVFLNFWATWCAPCRIEIPSLVQLRYKYENQDFVMLTVSIDQGGRAAVESFFRQIGVDLPTLLDTDNAVANLYGLTGVPETYLIDRQGRIVEHYVGPRDWTNPSIHQEIERYLKAPGSV